MPKKLKRMQKLLNKIMHNKKVIIVIVFLVFLIVSHHSFQNRQVHNLVSEDIFSEYDFSAQAIYIFDEREEIEIYSKNKEAIIEIASITKVMTALLAMEEFKNETISISDSAFSAFGDTGLLREEKWPTEKLVTFMLVNSSNDAAEAIAEHYPRGRNKFIERMNDRARELGLMTLQFKNPTGLNEVEKFGGRGSAREVATMFSYVYDMYPEIFEGTTQDEFHVSSLNTSHVAENTNLYADSYVGLEASKTGYTDKSGGSLAVRFNLGLNQPVTAVVLGTDGREERFTDILEVIRATARQALK